MKNLRKTLTLKRLQREREEAQESIDKNKFGKSEEKYKLKHKTQTQMQGRLQ